MASNHSSMDMEDFEGFSNNDLSDNITVDNLFDLYVSPTSDNISITFFQQSTHAKMLQILKSMYQLEPTKDNTGLTTTITLSNKKVVITVYNKSMKMLIQGTGCRVWLDTILEHIKCDLKQSECNNATTDRKMQPIMPQPPTISTPNVNGSTQHHSLPLSPSPIRSPNLTPQKNLTKSKSTGILSSVSRAIFGPSINSGMLKLGKELKKAKKTEKRGGQKVDYQEFNRQLTIIQETGKKPEQKLHKIGQSKWNNQ
jgi:hypothetical protein